MKERIAEVAEEKFMATFEFRSDCALIRVPKSDINADCQKLISMGIPANVVNVDGGKAIAVPTKIVWEVGNEFIGNVTEYLSAKPELI